MRVFGALARQPYAAFLDAGEGGWNGLSVLAYRPLAVLSSRGRRVRLDCEARTRTWSGDPLEALGRLLVSLRGCGPGCGLVGYLGYELGGQIERLPMSRRDDLRAPDMCMVHFGTVLTYDRAARRWYMHVSDPEVWDTERKRLKCIVAADGLALSPACPGRDPAPLLSNFRRSDYVKAVRRAKRYIRDGDIYQVNLSQRFTTDLREDPWDLYRRLRRYNPAPYACYLKYPRLAVVSSSPELFLRVDGRQVLTRPIKGTRPRGCDHVEDRRMRSDLTHSPKDRAELSMIVDLERNDLGRVCVPGSVRVLRHAVVERHPTVFHTVSDVAGTLRRGVDLVDLIRATFPGGSVTGCPKIRAMEIIDELEPTTRGLYTGAMGWLGAGGDAVLNIAIRTLLASDRRVSYQVGGAIVADSNPVEEYRETLVKGRALAEALGLGQGAMR